MKAKIIIGKEATVTHISEYQDGGVFLWLGQ